MQTKISTVQYPMVFTATVGAEAGAADGEYVIDVPAGFVLTGGATRVQTAFDGTTPTVSVVDNMDTPNTLIAAAALTAADAVASLAAGVLYTHYPAGGKLTIDIAGAPTVGELIVLIQGVVMGRQHERVGAYSAT